MSETQVSKSLRINMEINRKTQKYDWRITAGTQVLTTGSCWGRERAYEEAVKARKDLEVESR